MHEVISFPILEPKTVILGLWSEKTSNYILINHIVLLFKCYIFLKRKESKHIGFNRLKAFIKYVENTDNQIASRKQKVDRYTLQKMEPYAAPDVICILFKR